MANFTITLRVLTPLFMGGADPQKPELRAASIRGAMRFWFRAMAGAVTDSPQDVYRLESEVFGSTEKKSKVVVKVLTKFNSNDFKPELLLPHKNFTSKAIPSDKELKIQIFVNSNKENFLYLSFYAFWLSVTLGGWGRRSRRGAGSLVIIKIENLPNDLQKFLTKHLSSQLNIIKSHFANELSSSQAKNIYWPYLVKVKEWQNIFPNPWGNNSPLYWIFKHFSKDLKQNGKCLGQIKPNRYSSPLIIRVIKKENGYSVRFSILQSKSQKCSSLIDSLLHKIEGESGSSIEEVWHA